MPLTGFNFSLNGPTTATARYFDPTMDTDTDGILDWNEWSYYGSLGNGPTSDTDGDGFTYAEELARNQSPRVPNTLAHGGISRRRSPAFFVDTTGRLSFRTVSDPATILNDQQFWPAGTVVTVPDRANQAYSTYKFSWYDLNGIRQQDASGVAESGFNFTLNVNSTVTGHYVDPAADTDGDGILDWHEITYYGTLSNGPTSDTDGDGLTYAEELARNQSPRAMDILEHGGITRRRGAIIVIDPVITPTAPEIGALAATNIATTSARISALVNPMSAATTANFEFGPTTAFGYQVASESILNGFIADSMAALLYNLQPDTVYYFRVIATNNLGTRTSATGSFRTLPGLTPFEIWKRTYSVTDNTGDDDGDGVSNLIEYAFGLNPRIGSDGGRLPEFLRIELIGGRYWITCTQPQGVAGITYVAQYSTGLSNWTALADVGSGFAHEFWTPSGLANGPRIFVQVTVTLQ